MYHIASVFATCIAFVFFNKAIIRDAPKKKPGKCGNFEKTGGGVYPNPTSMFYCF